MKMTEVNRAYDCPSPVFKDSLFRFHVVVHVDHVSLEEFLQSMASVRPANARLAPTRMEALHGLEVFAVHVGLAELQFVGSAHGRVQAAGEDGRRETVL